MKPWIKASLHLSTQRDKLILDKVEEKQARVTASAQ